MSNPATFQQAFDTALRDRRRPVMRNRALDHALNVHRNTSARAAQDALADNYPVVRALTGDDAFAACAAAFASLRTPQDARLCFYGDGFDRFLSVYGPFSGLPYLADVARIERMVVEALFAADAPPLDGAALAAGLCLDKPLRLHPAARFGRFDFPAAGIWLAHQDGARPNAHDNLDWRPGAGLVTRPDGAVRVIPINTAAWAFLTACAGGRSLGEAAGAMADADIQTVFSTLINAGAFV
jgi:hypothetical protein